MTGAAWDVRRIDHRTALLIGLVGVAVPVAQTLGSAYDDPADLYAALRHQDAILVPVDDRTIRVVFADGAAGLHRSLALCCICARATALTGYFGRFPVSVYGLLVMAEDGDGGGHATTFGYGGPATRKRVGGWAAARTIQAHCILSSRYRARDPSAEWPCSESCRSG